MTTITHKRQSTRGIRSSKWKCNDMAEAISVLHGLMVSFYGRYEYDGTAKSYVSIPERDELHVFDTQTDAYFFLADLEWQLRDAEIRAFTSC